MAAIRFRTGGGERFDGFALDIEANVLRRPSLRTDRLLRLSRSIRNSVGRSYALGAIIPAPRGMQLLPLYWPGFPYRGLARLYDVFVPMGYFTYRSSTRGLQGAHDYTVENVEIIRRRTGNPRVPVHVIGGLAGPARTEEVLGFALAARRQGVLGASLYDLATTRLDEWAVMSGLFRPVIAPF